jgi:hypothetical protein
MWPAANSFWGRDAATKARFLAVFGGIGKESAEHRRRFPNPKGIESFSPGLRGTSYPGLKKIGFTTLKGLHLIS